MIKRIWTLFVIISVTSCSLAPTYHRPTVCKPIKFKESGCWLFAKPHQAAVERGAWWEMYHDPILNDLEAQVLCANQNIKAAIARYDEARAAVCVAKSDYFPTFTGVANATRQATSRTAGNPLPSSVFNDLVVGINLNYEIDVWGRIRNNVAAAKSTALASCADVAVINLSIHAELASDYFSLRGDDDAIRVLDATVVAYEKALYLTRKRYQGGAVSVVDVDRAVNQLETAKTLAADRRLHRQQMEHAIAVLIGRPPALFCLPPIKRKNKLVVIAPDLPSTLIERRPDIAEAEYKVQAANYNIGVARTAFFPAFNLASAIGFESATLGNLIKRPSLVWALGPTISSALLNNGSMPEMTQLLFDGGKTCGLTQEAWAQYHQTVANYRQTVLTAYQEVEDSLTAIRQLDREHQTQTKATAAANRALDQAMFRYKGGLTTYLDVVVAQNAALQSELSTVDVDIRRQQASVQLIKALGGGWCG